MHTIRIISFILLIVSCSPDGTSVGVNAERKTNSSDGAAAVNVTQDCGLKPQNAGGPSDYVVFSQKLHSLPIVTEGEQMGAKFRVTSKAHLVIDSKFESGTSQNLQVEVTNVEVSASSPLVQLFAPTVAKRRAEKSVKQISGPKAAKALSTAEWMNLVTSNGQFQNIFCAVRGSKSVTDNAGDETAEIEYVPVLPDYINPMASKETFETEIGTGRTFNVKAKLTKTKEGLPKVGEYDVVVKILPRSPSFSMSNGQVYTSDLAYDLIVDFKDGIANSPLSSKHSFFINLTTKSFDAIVDTSERVVNGIKSKPTVLLKE